MSDRPRTPLLWSLLVIALALTACGKAQVDKDAEVREAAFKEKYAKARALFEERCKSAGIFVKRTVKDVEGIELTKIRQPIAPGGKEYFDPMYPEAALAAEYRGDAYIKQFLMSESISKNDPGRRGPLNSPRLDTGPSNFSPRRGYSFVELRDQATGQLLRAELGAETVSPNLWAVPSRQTPISKSLTRYALTYEDVVDPEDRELWIAGTRLFVVDKATGDVIAQLRRFVWDAGFGASTTGRLPWEHANLGGRVQTCPHHPGARDDISRKFVDQVLVPKQGD